MGFTMASVSHTYQNIDGTPGSGALTWALSQSMRNGGTTYSAGLPVVINLNSSGYFVLVLPANNDAGTIPDGTSYTVTEKIAGAELQTWSVVVPTGAGAIDFASLLPQDAGA